MLLCRLCLFRAPFFLSFFFGMPSFALGLVGVNLRCEAAFVELVPGLVNTPCKGLIGPSPNTLLSTAATDEEDALLLNFSFNTLGDKAPLRASRTIRRAFLMQTYAQSAEHVAAAAAVAPAAAASFQETSMMARLLPRKANG